MKTDNADRRFLDLADTEGSFLIDVDRVAKILYSYERSILVTQLSQKREIVDPTVGWFGDTFLPDIYSYDTDWDKVKSEGKSRSSARLKSLCLGSLAFQSHGRSVATPLYNELVHLNALTKSNMARYHQKLNEVSRGSMLAIKNNVESWDTAIDSTKFIRDTSADVLIIGGTILPPARVAGVAIKTIGRYHHTGSIGQAAFEGVSNVVFMAIPDPTGTTGKLVLLLAKSSTDGAKVYLEKGDIEKAITAGVISGLTDGVMGKVLETQAAKKVFLKAALPIRTSLVTNEIALKHTFGKSLPTMYSRNSRAAIDLSKKAVAYAPEQAVRKALAWAASNVFTEGGNKTVGQSSLNTPIFSNIDRVDVGIYAI